MKAKYLLSSWLLMLTIVGVSQKNNTMPKMESIAYIMGKFDPAKHEDFTLVLTKYADRSGMYLRKDVLAAFIKMHDEAKKDSINLKIISATRNFDYQKGIWERKWNNYKKDTSLSTAKDTDLAIALKILEYSSMPGTSRHHWGTDIDINELNNAWFEKGQGKKVYEWMQTKGRSHGFAQVYTAKGVDRPTGYNEEKWHYSYLPLSAKLTEYAKLNMKDKLITGFLGAEKAVKIEIVKNYVLGIKQ